MSEQHSSYRVAHMQHGEIVKNWKLSLNQLAVIEHLLNTQPDSLDFWMNNGNRSRTVSSLVKHGLIKRGESGDRHYPLYTVTDDGRGVYQALCGEDS